MFLFIPKVTYSQRIITKLYAQQIALFLIILSYSIETCLETPKTFHARFTPNLVCLYGHSFSFIFFRITTFIALYILVTYCRMYSDKILDE